MNITDLIVELLQQGQKVELPEIGTFESVEQSPRHDPDARIYYPATRNIVFRSITTGDDSVVKEIARRECVSEDVARQMWSNYIDALSEKIKRSGEHRFGELGTLSLNGGSFTFTMTEGLVLDAGNANEIPLEEVKTYDHSDSDDPFAQFEDEPEVTEVQKVEPAPAPEPELAPAPEPEPTPAPEPEPVVAPEPEPVVEPAPEEAPADEPAQEAAPADADSWTESLRKLDELPKTKAAEKAEAKAEKERLKAEAKAEAKAEKERARLQELAEKDAAEEKRLQAKQKMLAAEREAEERRRSEEEIRNAEQRAEEACRKAEKSELASLQRAEQKAEEERIKAEKRAAILAAVAASQATGDNVVANTSVSTSAADALKAQKEAARRLKEDEKRQKAAAKKAEKERERQLKEEEKRRKEEEKRAREDAKEREREMKEEEKRRLKEEKKQKKESAKAVAAVETPVEFHEEKPEKKRKEKKHKEKKEGKKHRWVLWLLLILLLLGGGGAAYYFLVMRLAPTKAVKAVAGKHLNVPAESYFSFNPDMIEYRPAEISRNVDILCADMTDYIMEFLAGRNYKSARVPMMDRVRQYAEERMKQLMGDRYALQRFVPFEDYIYEYCEPWLKQTYASKVRHIVQGELMNSAALNSLLDNIVDDLGLQTTAPQRTAAEVQQVKETERAAVAPKKKAKDDNANPVYVYVEKNSKQGFDIIAGFYLNKGTAAKMTARLHEQGCDAYIIEKNDMYYVSMGSAPTRTKAEALYNHIKSWYDGDIVIKEL